MVCRQLSIVRDMVKSPSPPEKHGILWRDGRAAEGACLENMFGSHQRGFESHSLRSELQVGMLKGFQLSRTSQHSNLKLLVCIWGGARVVEWGRLLSGYRGEILGRRFESCPPRHIKNAFLTERVFCSATGPHKGMVFESYPPR